MSSPIPSILNWSGSITKIWEKNQLKVWQKFYWNQAERQLSTLQARWCLHALRIHSHALLYQATPGKPLAREPLRTTSSRQHKLLKGRESSQVYSRQPCQAAADRCLFMSDSGSASNSSLTQQISTYCTYITSGKLLEFLSIFSISLDWIPYRIHTYAEIWIYFFRGVVYWTNSWFLR